METQRVLVTGASGLLGRWLMKTAPEGVRVVGVAHRTPVDGGQTVEADLRDARAVAAAVAAVKPSVIVHTAYAKDRASIVDASQNIAQAANQAGADLVHISTDAVFNGDGEPCAEDATPDPIFDYGQHKLDAERAVTNLCPKVAIVRLSLIVSRDPEDHVMQRIRTVAAAGERSGWYHDELRQPALASELAAALWQIMSLERSERAGIWHLPGPETLSRFDLAHRLVAALGLDENIIESLPTPSGAQRPRHLNLRADRAKKRLGWSPTRVFDYGS